METKQLGSGVSLSRNLRGRRRPKLIALGVLLACVGGLLGALMFNSVTQQNQILVLGANVPRGEVIQRSDLVALTVGAIPGVAAVGADELASVVGQTAYFDLEKGSPLGPEAFGPPKFQPGSTQVGLVLAPGRVPGTELPAGTKVVLVEVAGVGQNSASDWQAEAIVITAPRMLQDGQTKMLDVSVDSAVAADVAKRAANNQIALIRSEP